MRNLSVMEQKQVVGGDYVVKFYDWDTGVENRGLRRSFNDYDSAELYKKIMLENGYGDYYHIIINMR